MAGVVQLNSVEFGSGAVQASGLRAVADVLAALRGGGVDAARGIVESLLYGDVDARVVVALARMLEEVEACIDVVTAAARAIALVAGVSESDAEPLARMLAVRVGFKPGDKLCREAQSSSSSASNA